MACSCFHWCSGSSPTIRRLAGPLEAALLLEKLKEIWLGSLPDIDVGGVIFESSNSTRHCHKTAERRQVGAAISTEAPIVPLL